MTNVIDPPCTMRGPRSLSRSIAALVFAVLVLAHLAAAVHLFWPRSPEAPTIPMRGTFATLLILVAALHARRCWLPLRSNSIHDANGPRRWRQFGQAMFVGTVFCYAITLVASSQPFALYTFVGCVAAWIALAAHLLVADEHELSRLAKLTRHPKARLVGWSLYAMIMLPIVAELGLRSFALLGGDPGSVASPVALASLEPGIELSGRRVNSQGYWDEEFSAANRSSVFRVAAIGDELTICGCTESNFIDCIERSHPWLEVLNFGVPQASPGDHASRVSRELAGYRPDLVLAFISVRSDVTDVPVPPGLFDRDALHICRLGARWFGKNTEQRVAPTDSKPTDRQTYLQATANQLKVLRTPLDDEMHGLWQQAFSDLDRLAAVCESRELVLALVVIPSEVQVDATLRDALVRRAGYRPEQIDVHLPQRRLAEYAQRKNIAILDLQPRMDTADKRVYERNSHALSGAGHQLIAQSVGNWLMSSHVPQVAAVSDGAIKR